MVKKQKRARLIYNPTSGQEIMKKNVAEVLDILEGFGYETSAFQTTPEENSARNEAERVAKAGFDLVIAAGGDGTINEVVNGIAPLEKRPKMAIIPTGTTNDFARALKIPRGNPVEAAKIIGKNQLIHMDIGQACEDTYFINIAAAGSFTELTYSVPSQLKTMFGYLAYLAKGVELLPGIRTVDDGKFTLILVKTANLIEILRLIRLVLDGGKHIGDKRIEYIKTDFLEIEPLSDKKMMINLDGEYGGDAPIVLRNLKNHITFFANTDEISDDALVWDQEDLALEAIAQKFAHEVEDLDESIDK